MNTMRRWFALLLALCMMLGLAACSVDAEDVAAAGELIGAVIEAAAEQVPEADEPVFESAAAPDELLDPDGSYTTKEDVALYLYTYGELPQNFMTKNEAKDLGWSGGGLDAYAPGMCIGGDRFGNYEGILPDGEYHECDIDTLGALSRGAKRIVYSDDGYIYYTEDHYESFVLLYPEEG